MGRDEWQRQLTFGDVAVEGVDNDSDLGGHFDLGSLRLREVGGEAGGGWTLKLRDGWTRLYTRGPWKNTSGFGYASRR